MSLSRRDVVGCATFFGAAMVLVRERAVATDSVSGSHQGSGTEYSPGDEVRWTMSYVKARV